jgi:hypothetical protein
MAEVGESLLQHTGLKDWRSINGHVLIALDGTDSFSSEKISCPCCSRQTQSNGKTRYRHTVVTPVLVAPGQERVVPLPPQFVEPQGGHGKQDCELRHVPLRQSGAPARQRRRPDGQLVRTHHHRRSRPGPLPQCLGHLPSHRPQQCPSRHRSGPRPADM